MTINRRTIVLGIPTLTGAMLTGCGPEGDPSSSAAQDPGSARATAQSIGTNVATGSVRISAVYGGTVGAFPTSQTAIVPSGTTYQACVNGNELHVILGDNVSGASRTIVLKLVNPSGWAPVSGTTSTVLSINMDQTTSTNYGSEGFFYNNPDLTSTAPTTSRYAYKVNAGQINVTYNGSNQVVIAFSPSLSTLVKATPVTSSTANAATGYVYIPAVGYSVMLNTTVETETPA